ncbi:MAG: hypothetical protein VB137_09760 [Burkholderia sp.]
MNRIQFQASLSMKEFQEQYGNEAQCEAARWGGVPFVVEGWGGRVS